MRVEVLWIFVWIITSSKFEAPIHQYFFGTVSKKFTNSVGFNHNQNDFDVSQYLHLEIPIQFKSWNSDQYSDYWLERFARIPEPKLKKRIFIKCQSDTELEIVLIEPRKGFIKNLIPSVFNIAAVYGGENVAFTVVCSPDNGLRLKKYFKERNWKNIRIIHIGGLFDVIEYSRMLTSKYFLEYFISKRILITHIDSFIIRQIDPYMYNYDLIGAPWAHIKGMVGNGGYSLRNINAMKKIVGKRKIDEVGYMMNAGVDNNTGPEDIRKQEDIYWATRIPIQPNESVALLFAVENFSQCKHIPTGVHQMHHYPFTFQCSAEYWRYWDYFITGDLS